MSTFRSAENSAYPIRKNYIRAESIITGYVIRNDPSVNGSSLFILNHTDVKGAVPKVSY